MDIELPYHSGLISEQPTTLQASSHRDAGENMWDLSAKDQNVIQEGRGRRGLTGTSTQILLDKFLLAVAPQ